MSRLSRAEEQVNHARFRPGDRRGHYESFFLRANHPTRPLAFWIRYTLVSMKGRPGEAIGELWAIFFDGETGRHTAVKRETPIDRACFARDAFAVDVGGARLDAATLHGDIASSGGSIAWDLRYAGHERPIFLFPLALYGAPLPRAKSLVGLPFARFEGTLVVDGRTIAIDGWTGSQNHNWGSKHTDEYAWAQVAGFDDDPAAFLEVATARLYFGRVKTPFMTPLVLRHHGREIALNSLLQAVRAEGSYRLFDWHFRSTTADVTIEGRVHAPREAFVGLRYANPPGGDKHCLNSKLASCELTVRRRGQAPVHLATASRAAFEILTDARDHGVAIRT
jgi:hypothetical protein